MDDLRRRPWSPADPDALLTVRTRFRAPFHIVALSGELDIMTGAVVVHACSAPGRLHVRVDLSGLTFMDCAGYRALTVAASILERRGGSLALTNAVGEPRRLLGLIDAMDLGADALVRSAPTPKARCRS